MARPRIYGKPAQYATELRAQHWRNAIARYLLTAASLAGGGLLIATFGLPVWVLVACLGLAAVGLYSAMSARKLTEAAGRASRGIHAEQQALDAAKRCPAVAAVFCGLQPSKAFGRSEDVDLTVVLTSGRVVILEVKHVAGGEVYWTGYELKTHGGRVIHGSPNPVDQVARQLNQLSVASRLPTSIIKPLVVCTNTTSDYFTAGPALVCSVAQLPDLLARIASHPTSADPNNVVKQLRALR